MALTCPDIVYPSVVSLDGTRYTKFPNPYGDTSQITASLRASGWGQEVAAGGTITGPAPLAVFFDAIGTTHGDAGIDTFRDVGYHFDFGYATPTTPGSWTHSSKPKGNQIGGPVAAHVFETAGTYTVSLRAEDGSANNDDLTLTVVVVDAATYWTGGGRTTTNIPVSNGAWPTWASNKRYTLDADGDYTAFGVINIKNLQNVCIAKTGAGADPIVADIFVDNDTSASVPMTGARVVFSQLSATALKAPISGTDVLFYKCSAPELTVGTSARGRYTAYPAQTWTRPSRIGYYECSVDCNETAIPFVTQSWQFMLLGCTLIDSTEHNLRVQGCQYGFIGHNRMYDPGITAGSKHCLTIRATGIDDLSQTFTSTTQMPASRYVVMADNYLAATNDSGTWPLYIGPQSNTASLSQPESLEYILAERTRYANRASYTNDWSHVRGCRQVTIRDETYDSGATNGLKADLDWGPDSLPAAWRNGPWYSNEWNETVDGVYRVTVATGIQPGKAGT